MEAGIFFLILFFFVGAIVIVTLNNRFRERELAHKETIAALEKGVPLPVRPQSAPWTSRNYLLHGMIWLFAGLAAIISISAVAVTAHHPVTMEERLSAVTIARARGATPAELEILLNAPREEERIPIGLALLGLIPVGIGLAYLIFYRVESRKLLS